MYTYWNSGGINGGNYVDTGMTVHDFNGDGSAEILVSGVLNLLTAVINRNLSMPLDSAYFKAVWLLEPTKGDTFCAPKLGKPEYCSRESFRWLVFSHPYSRLPVIEVMKEGHASRAKVGHPALGLYNMISYEGDVRWFRGPAWMNQFGDVAPPPLVMLSGTDQGIQAVVKSEYPMELDSTMIVGDVALPTLTIRTVDDRGREAAEGSQRPVVFDSTMKRIYHERDIQRVRELLRIYKEEDS